MRLTDCRYDRDRLRLEIAYRLIGYEVRTETIRQCTQLSADRIRRLFRDYVRDQPQSCIRRRRGKSPRQMSFFRRTPRHELEAATTGSLLRARSRRPPASAVRTSRTRRGGPRTT